MASQPPTDESNDERQTNVAARAEYRPDEDVPLRVTIDVPEHVLDAAGGFEDLTDSVRLRPAPSGED
jgi:hypothetical protein